jgi:hypothetical protein
VTQFKELAKAFSHKPTLISFGDDNQTVKHDGQQPGFLYVLSEPVGPDTVSYLPHTALTHWQTQCDLQVRLVSKLPADDPPQLSAEEIARMHRRLPEGKTGFVSDRGEG